MLHPSISIRTPETFFQGLLVVSESPEHARSCQHDVPNLLSEWPSDMPPLLQKKQHCCPVCGFLICVIGVTTLPLQCNTYTHKFRDLTVIHLKGVCNIYSTFSTRQPSGDESMVVPVYAAWQGEDEMTFF